MYSERRNCGLWIVSVKSPCQVRLLVTQELQPDKLLWAWVFPGKNTGVDCHFLLQWTVKECFELCWCIWFTWWLLKTGCRPTSRVSDSTGLERARALASLGDATGSRTTLWGPPHWTNLPFYVMSHDTHTLSLFSLLPGTSQQLQTQSDRLDKLIQGKVLDKPLIY